MKPSRLHVPPRNWPEGFVSRTGGPPPGALSRFARTREDRLVPRAPERLVEDDSGVGHVVESIVRVALKAASQEAPDLRRRPGGELAEVGIAREDGGEGVADGLPRE